MSTISIINTVPQRRHPINRYTVVLSTVMNRAGRLWRWGKAAAILKRATACWCITFLAVVLPELPSRFSISCTGEGKAAYGWQRDGGHAEYLLAEEKI